ncbi:hypothetical protein FGM00_17090 [Aggregatimonas sangjinii]|uniref:Uncharacterized protein n=1 Tax=Aggregatimonas sangjinii TaxID=2583587 RepID=A0A5B7SSU3_9FLAO|nr:hypothetical protein [Aggregatimonas sangjinii]QCX01746.1 hypothetical protein FGM00_17090 [Aggregatimonas sangjinii]
MRIVLYILLSLLLGMLRTHSQESETTTTEEKTNSISSISVNGEVSSVSKNERSYFSTSDSENTYKVRAKYNDNKTAKVRIYLLEELGQNNMTTSGSKVIWKVDYNGDTGYEVKLDDGSLRIFVNKELTSQALFNKFKTITQNIKSYTSGKSDAQRDQEALQRDQEQLKREAEQKIQEAERLQREAERLKREAERLEREAKRKTGDSLEE